MQVAMADELLIVDLVSDREAKLLVPDGPPGEMKAVAVLNDKSTPSEASFYRLSGDYPLITADPAITCKGVKFYNQKGELLEGTKNCSTGIVKVEPSIILQGKTIGGVAGTLVLPEPDEVVDGVSYGAGGTQYTGTADSEGPGECNFDGAIDCVANGAFKAAATSGLADKVLSGETVAGIPGNVSLPAADKALSASPSYGSFSAPITPSYSPDFPDVANVKAGDTVNGASGELGDCSTEGATGCVATSSFKAASSSVLLAGNIKSGVTIGGQLGDYPSSSYPLDGASGTRDLDSATFSAKIKSDTEFEYWSSDGARYTGQGDSDISGSNIASGIRIFGTSGSLAAAQCIASTHGGCESDAACRWTGSACEINPWHIRSGVTILGQTGSIKANCRNRANSSIYNSDTLPPGISSTTAGTSIDWWDTIDNFNNNLDLLPTQQPSGWTSDQLCGKELWSDVTADGACDAAGDDCMMKDNVTGLIWSEGYPVSGAASEDTTKNWSDAVSHCDSLIYGGRTDWRLPTQIELMTAYNHGIRELGYKGGGTIRPSGDTLSNNNMFIANVDTYFWSASSVSSRYVVRVVCESHLGLLTTTTRPILTVFCAQRPEVAPGSNLKI